MRRAGNSLETHRLSLVVPYGIAIVVLLVLIVVSQRVPQGAVLLETGWEYTWEDLSPREVAGGAGSWRAIDYPSNPPGRDGRSFVWYRRQLPSSPITDPHLFVFSIDTAARFYLDGVFLHSWNDWSGDGVPEFAGWPPQIVELPEEYAGRRLAVRVGSDYRDIGLWGRIFLGSEQTIYSSILVRDLPLLAIAVVAGAMLIGMTALRSPDSTSLGVPLALLLATLIVAVTSAAFSRVIILDNAYFWFVVETNAYLVVVAFAAIMVRGVVQTSARRWTTIYLILVTLTAIVANAGAALDVFSLHNFTSVIDALTVVGIVIVSVLLLARRLEESEHRFLIVNLTTMGVLFLGSLLVSYSVLPWVDNLIAIIVFQFVAGLAYVFLRRFHFLVLRLEEMNTTMEEQVDARTRVLAQINEDLAREREFFARESRRDSLTGLYNRAYVDRVLDRLLSQYRGEAAGFCLAMIDLDQFKIVNDEQGHLAGDRALQHVSRILQENVRESEVVARFGGDEFLVLFPQTQIDQAVQVARRIRAALEADREIDAARVTASIGVTAYNGQSREELIASADRALYAAKDAGRNRVEQA